VEVPGPLPRVSNRVRAKQRKKEMEKFRPMLSNGQNKVKCETEQCDFYHNRFNKCAMKLIFIELALTRQKIETEKGEDENGIF
jgi:hypothetical protein